LQALDNVNPGATTDKPGWSNFSLFLPYFLPYAAYVVIANLPFDLSKTGNYALRLLVIPAILAWAWRWYMPLWRAGYARTSILSGTACGVVGLAIWILFSSPFAPTAAPKWDVWSFALRMIAAATIVPVAEEFLLRGYVLRLAYQWGVQRKHQPKNAFQSVLLGQSINEIAKIKWSLPAVAISTMAFTLGHQAWEWPAAAAYGVLMCILCVRKQDLLSCVVAHSVTNIGLALYVISTGSWNLW
jgi:uncharacterized protein